MAAYEMARQLLTEGEAVSQIIMLDTPTPTDSRLSFNDKLRMFGTGLRTGGMGFLSKRISDRIRWELNRFSGNHGEVMRTAPDGLSVQSRQIGAAFERAVTNYQLRSLEVMVTLCRPKLDVMFQFPDGRRINADRRYIAEDNLWTPWVSQLVVHEVPGTHDSMVLEPNVRVLASIVKKAIST